MNITPKIYILVPCYFRFSRSCLTSEARMTYYVLMNEQLRNNWPGIIVGSTIGFLAAVDLAESGRDIFGDAPPLPTKSIWNCYVMLCYVILLRYHLISYVPVDKLDDTVENQHYIVSSRELFLLVVWHQLIWTDSWLIMNLKMKKI